MKITGTYTFNNVVFHWTNNGTLNGGNGNDLLCGKSGNDKLYGGNGSDLLFGWAGNDTLHGGAGNDVLFGGIGIDTAVFSGCANDYTFKWLSGGILQVSGKDGVDWLKDVEVLQFCTNKTYSTKGPIARSDRGSGTENQTITVSNVLGNDVSLKAGAALRVQKLGGGNAVIGDTVAIVDGIKVKLGANNGLVINPGATWDFLSAGQTITRTFDYKVSNGSGVATAPVTITITGTNDAAVVGGAYERTVTEAGGVDNKTQGSPTASGTLYITDADSGQAHFMTLSSAALNGTYGNFTFNAATGKWTYALDNSRTTTQALVEGTSKTDTLAVTSADGSVSKTIVVTVNGTNDAAVITGSATDSVLEASGVLNGTAGDATASGDLNATDVDSAATFVVQSNAAKTYGTFSIDATGAWSYTLNDDNVAVQALNTSSTPLHELVTVTTADGTKKVIDITINGANDAAVITGTATDSVTEASGVANGTPGDATASGDLDATDVDSSGAFVVQSNAAKTYGTFSIDATGAWSYTLNDDNVAVQALNTSSTPLHELVTVTTADGTKKVIDITINGANDAAVITGTATDSVTEASGVANGTPGDATASGDLDATDVDSSGAFVVQSNAAKTYGTFSIDATGAWSYTLNDDNVAVQALNTSSTPLHELVTVTTADGTKKVIDITINGANDAAVITGTATDSVTEASGVANGTPGDATASGDLDATDVDSSGAFVVQSSVTKSYGTFSIDATGAWSYTLDDNNAAVQALNTGGTLHELVTVATADGTTQVIDVTINGANDAAVITGTATDSVTEASGVANGTPGDATASGDLDATDVDSSGAFVVQSSVTKSYGTFSIDATGAWSYTLDDNNAAVQALNTGGTLHELVTVATADGTTQVIDVTINGANDAAVITGTATDSVTEASGVANGTPGDATASGDLDATDVDSSGAFVVQSSVTKSYGTFSIDATGAWSYTLDDNNAAVQALNTGGTLHELVTVATADGTTQVIDVTINGANDAPVLAPFPDETIAEGGSVTATAAEVANVVRSLVSDVDSDATYVIITGPNGFVYNSSSGTPYTYTPDENFHGDLTFTVTAFDALGAASATQTVTLTVTPVNDAPSGTDNSKTINEDGTYTFAAADFGFSDANDGNAFAAVKITTLATNGTLKLDGVAVTLGQLVSAADIAANKLTFVPAANANGNGHANFTFQVQDNGGIAHGGVDLDPSANTFTINVTSVNDAPAGADKTVTTNEDGTYTFAAADFGFSDANDGNTLEAVKITTLATNGTLKLDGVAVTLGQLVSAADIAANKLTFVPAANANGNGYANFTFQVQDNGGIAHGGVDLDPSANTFTINVTSVNDAPAGADKTVTTNEDGTYTFAAADFGFSDANDGNTLEAVKITTLATNGTLKLDGVAVTLGQLVSAADIAANKLTFVPAANANGNGYANFTFQVQDNGGIAHGGVDLDPSANTFTINVTSVNDAPAGADKTVTTNEDGTYTFAAADFGFSDANDGNTLEAVKITTLATNGTLKLDGVAVTLGQLISAADIAANKLTFVPAANANGNGHANFTFQVQDNGGIANGGVDLDPSANTFTINVTSVNDAPAGADKTVTTNEDGTYTFAAADFGFSDANDGNTLEAVKITTLATNGTLKLDGVAVTLGQLVSAADIAANKLTFVPAANANGNGYANFTFQVQDNGGIAHGGVDLDPSANTFTINVTSVNDAPVAVADTNWAKEDTNTSASGNVLQTLAHAGAPSGSFSDKADTDPDALDALTVSALSGGTNDGATFTRTGTYGTLVITKATGAYTYTLANGQANVQALAAGQQVFDTFSYTVSDGHGGMSTANLAVSVFGTDDVTPGLITVVADGSQGNNTQPSVVHITFSNSNMHENFTDITAVMHVSNTPTTGPFIIVGDPNYKAGFTAPNEYTFYVNKGPTSNNGTDYKLVIDVGAFSDNAGHSNASVTKDKLKPAGVAGESIKLGLADFSSDPTASVAIVIRGVPQGWALSEGVDNGGGCWTVHTTNPSALTITSPVEFIGAIVLDVNATWTNADGTTGSTFISNNIEVFAPGNPIYALSTEDHLTGSSGSDLFVFGQPIAHDTLHSFDATADKIDLIGFNGVSGFGDLAIADDASGNAVVTISATQTITVFGVSASELNASNFLFNEEPVTHNAGTISIADGAIMPLGGIVENTGTIALNGAGGATQLDVIVKGLTLTGGGHVALSDNDGNFIFGGAADAVLNNVDNTISGAGQIGGGQLKLINGGTIDANGGHALVIDTGAATVTNTGLLEASGSGGLVIESNVDNTGNIWANGGNVTIHGDVAGGGAAKISGTATLELDGASDVRVRFDDRAHQTLRLDEGDDFAGTVAGLSDGDSFDFSSFRSATNATFSYSENAGGLGGRLTASDGIESISIQLVGSYDPADFTSVQDPDHGLAVTYHASASVLLV